MVDAQIMAREQNSTDRWIFAYGSLMWRPGFGFVEAAHARLTGYHRSFCIHSTHHRGSAERPGLVLGLDRGKVCSGIAYRISGDQAESIIGYLRKRELVSGVYREALLPVTLAGEVRREVLALAFIVERAHPSYVARLSLAEQARLIRGAKGISGANLDYLANTMRHLQELGIRERSLERLLVLTGPYIARAPGAPLESPRAAALLRACRDRPVRVRRMPPAERRRFLYRTRLSSQTCPTFGWPDPETFNGG
jgi:cation transport protein ChaC